MYAKRNYYGLDCEAEGPGSYYTEHVSAMTSEGLHSKSAIAGELAVRDAQIVHLLYVNHNMSTDSHLDLDLEKALSELPQFKLKE